VNAPEGCRANFQADAGGEIKPLCRPVCDQLTEQRRRFQNERDFGLSLVWCNEQDNVPFSSGQFVAVVAEARKVET
jgi:hypothetical protein